MLKTSRVSLTLIGLLLAVSAQDYGQGYPGYMQGQYAQPMNDGPEEGAQYMQNSPPPMDGPTPNRYPPQMAAQPDPNSAQFQPPLPPQYQGGYQQMNQGYDAEPAYHAPRRRLRKARQSHRRRKAHQASHHNRRTYLNTTFDNYTAPQRNYTPDPKNPDWYTKAAVDERNGPVDYYPHFTWFNRFENFPGFNQWFQNLWRTNRFTHEYRYDLIDTNFFIGNPETVGNPIYSDQEAVDLQNYEQHFAHLQKILADERTDQDFVIEYSKERAGHERMLRLRETRNNIYQSVLQMERLIYAEQDKIVNELRNKSQAAYNQTITNITAALANLTEKPHYPKFPSKSDIFVS